MVRESELSALQNASSVPRASRQYGDDEQSLQTSIPSISPSPSMTSIGKQQPPDYPDNPPPYSDAVVSHLYGNQTRLPPFLSLGPTSTADDGRRRLLVVYIHGLLDDNTSLGSIATDTHSLLSALAADTHVVFTTGYTGLQRRQRLQDAAQDLSYWLAPQESPNTDIVLVGHGIGGLLAAEVALLPPITLTDQTSLRHRVLGLICFDTPFLGIQSSFTNTGAYDWLRFDSDVVRDFDGLKLRYCRIRMLEDSDAERRRTVVYGYTSPSRTRFVNYYTDTSASIAMDSYSTEGDASTSHSAVDMGHETLSKDIETLSINDRASVLTSESSSSTSSTSSCSSTGSERLRSETSSTLVGTNSDVNSQKPRSASSVVQQKLEKRYEADLHHLEAELAAEQAEALREMYKQEIGVREKATHDQLHYSIAEACCSSSSDSAKTQSKMAKYQAKLESKVIEQHQKAEERLAKLNSKREEHLAKINRRWEAQLAGLSTTRDQHIARLQSLRDRHIANLNNASNQQLKRLNTLRDTQLARLRSLSQISVNVSFGPPAPRANTYAESMHSFETGSDVQLSQTSSNSSRTWWPLSGPPLSGPSLSGPPLSGPPLSGPPLSGPPLSVAPLSGPPLSGPTLSGPALSGHTFSGPALRGPTLSGMALSNTSSGMRSNSGNSGIAESSKDYCPVKQTAGNSYKHKADSKSRVKAAKDEMKRRHDAMKEEQKRHKDTVKALRKLEKEKRKISKKFQDDERRLRRQLKGKQKADPKAETMFNADEYLYNRDAGQVAESNKNDSSIISPQHAIAELPAVVPIELSAAGQQQPETFCNLPPLDEHDNPDPTWVKVPVADMDGTNAHRYFLLATAPSVEPHILADHSSNLASRPHDYLSAAEEKAHLGASRRAHALDAMPNVAPHAVRDIWSERYAWLVQDVAERIEHWLSDHATDKMLEALEREHQFSVSSERF